MMRRITKFFLFLLVGVSLAVGILNFGGLYLLRGTSDSYNKRDLRHWLSLQARVEALEEAADVFAQDENEIFTETAETETTIVTSPEAQTQEPDTRESVT